MKKLTTKTFAFIIALTMLSAWPEIVSAQMLKKCNQRGKCPSGYHCYFGYCVRDCTRCPGSLANEALFISSCEEQTIFSKNIQTEKLNPVLKIYLNPLSNSTSISFTIDEPQNVSIKNFDANGKLIKVLADAQFEKGQYEFKLNTERISAGIYFLRFDAGVYSDTKELSVVNNQAK